MKYLTIVSLCLIFSTSLILAQDKDSTDVTRKEEKTKKQSSRQINSKKRIKKKPEKQREKARKSRARPRKS